MICMYGYISMHAHEEAKKLKVELVNMDTIYWVYLCSVANEVHAYNILYQMKCMPISINITSLMADWHECTY